MKLVTFLWFILIGLSTCQENGSQPANRLNGTKWQLLGYGDQTGTLVDSMPDDEPHTITIIFSEDTVSADLAVNEFFGNYHIISDTLLTIANLVFTEALGSPWEQKFINNFPYDTCRYQLLENRLVLFPMGVNYWGEVVDDQPSVYQKID